MTERATRRRTRRLSETLIALVRWISKELPETSGATPSTETPATLPCGVARIRLDEVSATPVTVTVWADLLEVPATVAVPLREKVATPSTASAGPVPVVDACTAGPVPFVVAESAGEELDVLSMDASTALPVPAVWAWSPSAPWCLR
jgi:hypothetical protein